MKPKDATLRRLLAQKKRPEWTGGQKCVICHHARRSEIERDIKEAIRSKSRGSEIPWAVLYREYFKPEYKLQIKRIDPLINHAKNCLKR